MRAILRCAGAGAVSAVGAVALAWVAASSPVGAQAGVDWSIFDVLERAGVIDTVDGNTTSSDTTTSSGAQQSSEGQRFTDATAHQVNGDGTAHESERLCGNGTFTNPLTKNARWHDDGSFSSLSRDWDRDAAGHATRRTIETIVDKDGNRTTTTADETFDEQGHGTSTKDVTRDKVETNAAACFRPYWAGTIKVTSNTNLSPTPAESSSFGIGRNQKSTVTEQLKMRDVVTLVVLPPDPLHGGTPAAIITRTMSYTETKDLASSQELWCDSKWNAWSRAYKKTSQANGTGSGRGAVGIAIGPDGAYTIHFSSVRATGTLSTSETDTITPGKCWGTARNPSFSGSGPMSWPDDTWEVKGRVDPEHPKTLSGQQGDVTWSLTRVNPARPTGG